MIEFAINRIVYWYMLWIPALETVTGKHYSILLYFASIYSYEGSQPSVSMNT